MKSANTVIGEDMEPTTDAMLKADPLQYPYEPSNTVPTQFQDVYKRRTNRLLASLARYGQMVKKGEALLTSGELEDNLDVLTRFAADSSQPSDFDILLDTFPLPPSPTRHVFDAKTLRLKESEVLTILNDKLNDLAKYEQIAFPHFLHEDHWAVFVVFPLQSVIEVYSIGSLSRFNINMFALPLCRVLDMAGFTQQFQVRRRFETPATFPVNPVTMTLIIVRELHDRGKYLELNHEMIMQRKLVLLDDFIKCHDHWLGKLVPRVRENKSHPFLTTEYEEKDDFSELEEMGWKVIDVEGDGNCGYYSILLGLENNGNHRYSPSQRGSSTSPMPRNEPWQDSVIKIRRELQEHSEHLLNTVYTPDKRHFEWFMKTSATTDEDFKNLSESFYTDRLTQEQYFDWTLAKEADDTDDFDATEYQMNPFWSSLVASSYFDMRIIVYTRSASFDSGKKKIEYSWSTTFMNTRQPMEEHIVQDNDIVRLTDNTFNKMPTIEILYTTGFVNTDTPDSQHFQFLRRVFCDNVPSLPGPSPENLKDLIQELTVTPDTTRNRPQATGNPPHTIRNRPVERNAAQPQATENLPDTTTNRPLERNVEQPQATANPPRQSKGKTVAIVPRGKVPRKVPRQSKRKSAKPKLQREMKQLMDNLTEFFNRQFHEQTSKHKTATRMKFDPIKKQYFTRTRGDDGKLQKQKICRNISEYDNTLVDAAQLHAGQWVGPSAGDSGDGHAPIHLCTDVKLLYQQHGNPFCFIYSLANALFYCKYNWQAIDLAGQAPRFAAMHSKQAISELKAYMANLLPVIGRPTLYGIRTGRNKKKRTLTFDDLFTNLTPYPTLVVPFTTDVNSTHAFCVIDDLIFDSITPFALKLQKESVDWIFNGADAKIDYALRFNMKVSPRGVAIDDSYVHELTYHWDHPSRPKESDMDIDREVI